MAAFDRPILVTGTPRAGKTVVREIMGAAAEFVCVGEPLMVWNCGLGARPHDRRTAEDATPEVTRWIREECARMLRQGGRERYLDDLSYHTLRIPFVRAVMPEARIILVIRSAEEAIPEMLYGWTVRDTVGRAVKRRWANLRWRGLPRTAMRFARNYVETRVRGRRSTWGPRPPGLAEVVRRGDVAEAAAFQWRTMNEVALADLGDLAGGVGVVAGEAAAPWLEVRLDRLVAEPRRELERLVAFCEPRDPEAVMEHGMKLLNANHHFEKKAQPTDDQWATIRDQVGPLQRRLGYWAADPAIGPGTTEPVSRT